MEHIDIGSALHPSQIMLRKLILAAAITSLLTGAAFSQAFNLLPTEAPKKSAEELEKEKQIEHDYRSTMDKIPDQKKKSNDPWGNVRSAPAASSAVKQPR
jgi:hypothetical protein